MIFSKTWARVLDGTKTQTRRLVEEGDLWDRSRFHNSSIVRKGRRKWIALNTYAVQPARGEKAVGRIRLLRIRRERLQDISLEDVKAEGFGYLIPGNLVHRNDAYAYYRTFELAWDSIHRKGNRWADNPEVWVLEFELT